MDTSVARRCYRQEPINAALRAGKKKNHLDVFAHRSSVLSGQPKNELIENLGIS